MKSKAKNTTDTYLRGPGIWKEWITNFKEIEFLPANSLHVALCIQSLVQSNSSYAKVKQLFYGLKWVHKMLDLRDPCKTSVVVTVNEAAKRVLSKPVTKKEPIKPCHLKLLAKKFGGRDANLMNLRLLALCTVGFAGFLRFDELSSIKRSDIIFHNTYMKIFIEKSKTDIYRDGAWVVIAKTKRITCPVKILRRYVNRLKFPPSSEEYIFRALFYSKKQKIHKCRKSNKPLSYSRTRDIVLDAFEKIGLPRKRFALHSLRAGGATAAANAGVSNRLFKRHGRWKSDRAKDGYVKDNIAALLSVSKNLGI